LRRRIITEIGDNQSSSFTKLKKALDVSTGTIYHHLDALSELIEQKEDKKYYLTELGQLAFNYLQENKLLINSSESIKKYKFSKFLDPILNPSNKKENLLSIGVSIICLMVGFIFAELNKVFSILLFYVGAPEFNLILLFGISFIGNYLLLAVIVEGLLRVIFKKKGEDNMIRFFRTFSLVFFPLILYLVVHYAFKSTEFINIPVVFLIDRSFLILSQGFSVWILSYDLTINRELKMENGLILSLLLHLSSFIIITTFLSF
jgi:hypothetical protein